MNYVLCRYVLVNYNGKWQYKFSLKVSIAFVLNIKMPNGDGQSE